MLRKQLTIVSSWTFSSIGQAECAQFIVDRKVDVDRLFTHNWKLDQAEEAYRLFDTQTTGKGVFLMYRLSTPSRPAFARKSLRDAERSSFRGAGKAREPGI